MNGRGVWICLMAGLGLLLSGTTLYAVAIGDPNADTWAKHSAMPPVGSLERHYEPVVISAADFQPLWGQPFANLRLYSYQQDKWKMVTAQFDDRLPDNHMVFIMGPRANPKDGNQHLDAKDEIIFMARDAGEKCPQDKWPAGVQEGIEIKLVDPLAKKEGYLYLFCFPQNPPKTDFPELLIANDDGPCYVGGSQLWQVAGITNVYKGKTYKNIINGALTIPKIAGGSGQNILDRMKYRAEVRFLFGILKLDFNENKFIGEVSQYRPGPLRLSVRNWAQFILPAQFKSPKLWAEMYLYESFVVTPIRIRVPFNPNTVITDFRMSMGYDLNEHARGMKFYNSNNLEGFVIDGEPTPEEKAMNTDADDWRCVTGPQGSILTYSIWDPDYKKQAKINVYYVDDIKRKYPPDTHAGSFGYFFNESTIASLQPRDYSLAFYVCFPPNFYDPKGLKKDILNEYLNMKQNPVFVVVNGKKNRNRIAYPEPMWPKFD